MLFTELNRKNRFVLDLREHLKSIYRTENHYTYGESDFESKKVGNMFSWVRRDLSKPKDISGFCFRKNLCSRPPQSVLNVLKEIHEFSLRDKNLESVLEKDGGNLEIKFGDKKYLVTSYIDGGYAGEVSVHFAKLPDFSEIVAGF